MISIYRRFVLRPNQEQVDFIENTYNVCDEIYNTLLEYMSHIFRKTGKCVTKSEASKYFERVLLPANEHWRTADSRSTRVTVFQCVKDFYQSKGDLSYVDERMYPKAYRTYVSTFKMSESLEHVYLPIMRMVEVSSYEPIKGNARFVYIISEAPSEYVAMFEDQIERATME